MLIYITSLILLLSTPGPGVLSLAGVGSAFGYRTGWFYGAGLFVGSNTILVVSAMGLATLLLADARLQLIFGLLSTGYLLYLAFKIAFAGSKIAFIEKASPPSFWDAFLLNLVNPKAYAIGTFIFSNFPIWPDNTVVEIVLKLLIFNMVWLPIHVVWLAVGVSVHRLQLPLKTQRKINITMAVAMLLVVGLAVWSSLFGL